MNYRLVSWLLGWVALLIGCFMVMSLPWALPGWGVRNEPSIHVTGHFETRGFLALAVSIVICLAVGGLLMRFGRRHEGRLFRKETMAVVGLSWMLATFLGACPYLLSRTSRGPAVRLHAEISTPSVVHRHWLHWGHWVRLPQMEAKQAAVLQYVLDGNAIGRTADELGQFDEQWALDEGTSLQTAEEIVRTLALDEYWTHVLLLPGSKGPDDRRNNFRVRYVPMTLADALFESQSGFSTTGATVISDLEDPHLIPHCILFWRSSTHFLGGLGIIVLFVALLGQGSAGKALMRAELPGPSSDSSTARMQHAAIIFAALYAVMNVILTVALKMQGLTWFDALCHAFGAMATGGFSTYNGSLGHFQSAVIEYTVIVFMILAGSNFTLLYAFVRRRPSALLRDVEWRTYMGVIIATTALIVGFGLLHEDFVSLAAAVRYGLFQVVSIVTTTGYGTHDFDRWNNAARALLLLLMFVGGCAGSTGGGLKVIRHVLFFKILRLEIEQSFHPSVVRPLRVAGRPVDDPDLRRNILVYFGMVLVLFTLSWLFLLITEPDATWVGDPDHKLIDTASAVAATLNNVGPGLGTVGATQNYGHFSWPAKILFTWLMMLGRVEIYVILCIFVPRFWRNA
ncbi:MAG: TrkH family potassium uptake protein [Planctomycetales bacterium]|nr:TrkH family potassium uptake protein [Planctomycetales bacterium]